MLTLVANAAFADTDDRRNTLVAVTPLAVSVPASASMPGASTISLVDLTAAIDMPAVSPAATTPERMVKPVVIAAFGHALDAKYLEGQRGGAEAASTPPMSTIFANGAVTDNRAVDVITGSNTIRDGAFANASGLPIVIQNTGANVLIQSATIVNVQLR